MQTIAELPVEPKPDRGPGAVSSTRRTREIVRTTTLEGARQYIKYANSYTRIEKVLELWWCMDRGDWFEILGDVWQSCDNIGIYTPILRKLLRGQFEKYRDRMMTGAEREALAALPERITVYRGCYWHNRRGLSWTTDRDVAARFPFYRRYLAKGQPLLLTAWTRRDRAVLKLDCEEHEVIAERVNVVSTELIPTVQPVTAMSA
jgi:hypothetical protein